MKFAMLSAATRALLVLSCARCSKPARFSAQARAGKPAPTNTRFPFPPLVNANYGSGRSKRSAIQALVSKGEAAARWGVSTRTFDRLRQTDAEFPTPYVVLGVLRWRADELDAWLEEQRDSGGHQDRRHRRI